MQEDPADRCAARSVPTPLLATAFDALGFAAARYLNRRQPPPPSGSGGMGLWIVQQTSDAMSIDSGSTGTTIRISAVLPGPAASDRSPDAPADVAGPV